MKRTWQPKKRKRAKTHGFRARTKSASGRNVLRRLRRNTLRPEALLVRARNPCVLARLRFLGCHVRFIRTLYSFFQSTQPRKHSRYLAENLAQHICEPPLHTIVVNHTKKSRT